jgi:hypothetical protein
MTTADHKAVNGPSVKDLHYKIVQLEMENHFLAYALGLIDDERQMMIDRKHRLPVVQQCRILKLSRSSVYYLPHLSWFQRPTWR